MEHKTGQQKTTAPSRGQRQKDETTDQVLLYGLPLRHSQQDKTADPAQDRISSFVWLRVPVLLLGVVGALGLLAQDNPRFAQQTSLIHWPGQWVSMVFLGLAGCVFVLLLAERLYVNVCRCIRLIHRKRNPERINWRCR